MTNALASLASDLPSLLLRVTVVLAVASFLANLLPRASAAVRHAIQLMGLLAALGVPVLFLSAPAIAWIPNTAGTEPATAVVHRAPASTPSPAFVPSVASRQANSPADTAALPRPAQPETAFAGGGPARTPHPLLMLWGIGSFLALLPLLLAPLRLRALWKRSGPATDESLLRALAEAADRLGVSWLPELRLGADGVMPMCFGFVKSAVLLPAEAAGWRSNRLRVVLLHELAHLRRHDLWTHALAGVARAAFWFHPLAWLAHRQLAGWREQACDDLVLASGEPAVSYGEELLQLARAAAGRGPGLAMARPSSLEARMRALLDPRRRRTSPGRFALAGGLLSAATLGVVVSLSGYQLAPTSAEGFEPTADYAAMSAPELIDAITAADDRRRTEIADWENLHLMVSEVDEDVTAGGTWDPWGPRSEMSLWLADARSSRFRVDFLPIIRKWHGGARPFAETRLSKRWDGRLFQKLDWLYGGNTGAYGGRVSEERKMEAGSEDWRNQTRDWKEALGVLLNDRNAAAGLRFHSSNRGIGGVYLNAELAEEKIWVFGIGLFGGDAPVGLCFDPAHGLRLAKVLRLANDGSEAKVLYEVTDWREVPGTGVILPARWTSPAPSADRPEARRVSTLNRLAFFEPAGDPGEVYRVVEADLARGQKPPFRQPKVSLQAAAIPAPAPAAAAFPLPGFAEDLLAP